MAMSLKELVSPLYHQASLISLGGGGGGVAENVGRRAMQDHNQIQTMCEIRIITNGYIVSFGSKDVFCRDAEDIGKAVVSLFTANKLAPKQLDLFDNEQEKNSNGK